MSISTFVKSCLQNEWINLFLLFLCALGLRLFNLEATSLWMDEIYSLMVANVHLTPEIIQTIIRTPTDYYHNHIAWQSLTLPQLLEVLKINVHMPLYYLLLNPWLGFFGNDAVGLRSFSALFSTLMLVPVYFLGKALGKSRRAGILAFVVAALVPFQIYYGQEGRMYALSLFWAALASLSFWKVLYDSKPLGWSLLYAISVAGGVLSHYMFVFFLGFHLIYGFIWLARSRDMNRFLLFGFALATLTGIAAWWFPVYQVQQQGINEDYHFAKGLMGWPRYATALVWQPLIVVAGDNKLERLFHLPITVILFLLFLFKPGQAEPKTFSLRREGFLLMWILLPVLFQIGYDLIKLTHTAVIDRYAMLISPAMALWLGLSLDRLMTARQEKKFTPRRYLQSVGERLWQQSLRFLNPTVFVVLMLVFAIANVWHPSPFRDEHNKDKDIRGKLQYMVDHAQPNDLVFVNGPWGAPLIAAYYLEKIRPKQPMLYWINNHQGQPVPLPDKTLLKPYQRVWLFRYRANNERGLQQAKDYLQSQYPQWQMINDWFLYTR